MFSFRIKLITTILMITWFYKYALDYREYKDELFLYSRSLWSNITLQSIFLS